MVKYKVVNETFLIDSEEKMVRCESCFEVYDEQIAVGVCPHCGHYKGDVDETSRHLPIGTVIANRYVVGGTLGDGGFGITYRVWDMKLSTVMAMKEYYQLGVVNRIPGTTNVFIADPKRSGEFEYGKKRLLREAQIVAGFQSEHVVRVSDYFEDNGTSYMVMEYLDCQTLTGYMLSNNRTFDEDEVKYIALQMLDALSEMHKSGVIHRDIAPDNIFINADGLVKIIDFGSARLAVDDTVEQLVLVKEGFSPIEQYETIDLKKDNQKGWTDIYALGATLYYCLTGARPEESKTRKTRIEEGGADMVDPIFINPNISENFNNIIMKAMAINIHERFSTAEEIIEILEKDKKVLSIPQQRKRKRTVRFAGILGGVAIMAAIVLGAFFVNTKRVLDKADIEVWYIQAENEDVKSAMQEIRSTAELSPLFERVNIELKGFDKNSYIDAINKAAEAGNLPTVFECVDEIDKYGASKVDVGKIYGELTGEYECKYIKAYEKKIDGNEIPLGFKVPVVYLNTNLIFGEGDSGANIDAISISSIRDILAIDEDIIYKPLAVTKDAEELFSQTFDDYSSLIGSVTVVDQAAFVSANAPVMLGTTDDFFAVRNDLAGTYKMVIPSNKKLMCKFSDFWTISECSDAEMAAARAFLVLMYSEGGQDRYFMDSDMSDALPLNKKSINNYRDVYPSMAEVFDEKNMNRYVFE